MRIHPAIIFTAIVLALGVASTAIAQEPSPTPVPTETPAPTATPLPNGSIEVCVEADNRDLFFIDTRESRDADSIPNFFLRSDSSRDCRTFDDLEDGRYRFTAREEPGYELRRVSVRGHEAGLYTSAGARDREATIDLTPGHDYRVLFVFEEVPDATPAPSATSTPVVDPTPRTAYVTVPVPQPAQIVVATPTPTPFAVVGSAVTILPPSTGDAGLVE